MMLVGFLLLSCLYFLANAQGNSIISTNDTLSPEKNYLRTLSVIEQRSNNGRLILLICKRRRNCQRSRIVIPQWVREFNEIKHYTGIELIHYHFHVLTQPLPFMNTSEIYNFPLLVHFLAERPTIFPGPVTDKVAVLKWIEKMDYFPDAIKPQRSEEVDSLLDKAVTGNCTENKYLVLMDHRKKCPYENWNITARVIWQTYGIFPVHFEGPLSTETLVVLHKRLPSLDKIDCYSLFLLTGDTYSFPFYDTAPIMVSEVVGALLAGIDSCEYFEETEWQLVQPQLTELQLIYLSGEYELAILEHNWSYIWIGVVGGGAVCTLAFSIFWGLNGSAFAK